MLTWIKDKYWNVQNGIRQLCRYAPIIWKNREWDQYYLLVLLETKFRRMAVAIGDDGHLVKAAQSGKQLRICAELCRRIREDEYYENVAGPIEYKHWTTPCEFDHAVECHIESYRDGRKMEWPEIKRLHEMADRNKQNDIDYLCRMISKHLQTWWD